MLPPWSPDSKVLSVLRGASLAARQELPIILDPEDDILVGGPGFFPDITHEPPPAPPAVDHIV
jgi:hypothetical protein